MPKSMPKLEEFLLHLEYQYQNTRIVTYYVGHSSRGTLGFGLVRLYQHEFSL